MNLKKYISVFAVVLVLLSLACFAQDEMTIKFAASEPDENGVFALDVSFCKMEFLTYQFAVRYDKTAVQPINPETGEAAQSFDDFSEYASPNGLHTIGEYLSTDDGFFDFSGYVMPNDTKSGLVKENGNALTDENFLIYTVYFKKTGDKDYGFELAMADGNGAYYNVFPQGASVFCFDGIRGGKAVFSYGKTEKTQDFDSTTYAPKPVLTKAKRLKNTIYFQNGNYAAACDGALKIVDENKNVVPTYAEDKLLVPLRFVCTYFGFEVDWDDTTKTVGIKSQDKDVKLDLRSDDGKFTAIIQNDRTMISADDLAELFGIKAFYPEDGKSVVLTMSDEDWQKDRTAEKEALEAMKFAVSPFIKIFA